MRAQITLTVSGSKRLIAKGLQRVPEVRAALDSGRVLLKGGTTVSAVAEELGFAPLRISGRITRLGTKSCAYTLVDGDATHSILVEGGVARDAYSPALMQETVALLGPGDVVIIGANLIDAHGGAAMMAGAYSGGATGQSWEALQTEGVNIIIAAGLEKLIPGRIEDAVRAAGRKKPDLAMGMSVGLMPLFGRVFTEVDACLALGADKVEIIGRGGIHGGEGSVTLVMLGQEAALKEIFHFALKANKMPESGSPMTLVDCTPHRSSGCDRHYSCVYFHPELLKGQREDAIRLPVGAARDPR